MAHRDPKTKRRNRPLRRLSEIAKQTAKADFLEEFIKHGYMQGAFTAACVRSPWLTRNWLYLQRDSDPKFGEAWLEALEIGTEKLEQEAYRRAHEGVKKPIYQGGEKVGSVREFSDTLMMFLLKARRPKVYRERVDVNVGGQVNHQHVHIYMPSNGREVAPPLTIVGKKK